MPAKVLLSSFLATVYPDTSGLRSSFSPLLGIITLFFLFPVESNGQTDSIKTDSIYKGEVIVPVSGSHWKPRRLNDSIRPNSTSAIKDSGKIKTVVKILPLSFDPRFDNDLNRYNLTPEQKKKRIWLVAGANVVGYSTAMIALSSAWYSQYEKTGFHTFNDFPEWKQMDKVGHLYAAYIESYGSMELWRWTGIDRKKRIWIGGMSGAVYQTVIEVLDGFSAGWGWSWGDFAANIIGSGALVAQELAWDDQRIKLKFSFHRKNYADAQLNQRSNLLFGKSTAERLLKDYNGQTYWASINLKPFFKNSNLPPWLSLSVGYGAEGMFGGTENIGKDSNGNIIFDRRDIKRYRQWYLAPDIDLSKIKTKSKAINFLFTFLSAFKFPAPSVELSNGKLKVHTIHF